MDQKFFSSARLLGQDAEKLFRNEQFEQSIGVTYVANCYLMFLLNGELSDVDAQAEANLVASRANPTVRPFFSQSIAFARAGLDRMTTNPLAAKAAFKLAELYYLFATHWEPADDDEPTRQQFAELSGLIERQSAVVEKTVVVYACAKT
ncbi:MAG: hypothetical protein V1738_05250 [Patescibacteria group bacterium]